MAKAEAARPKCTADTKRGTPCRRSAMEGTDPPLCQSHVAGFVGRKTVLTDEIAAALVRMLKAGNYLEVALTAAGVSRSTFYDWLARGTPEGTKKADEEFRSFRRRIERARAEGEARNVQKIAVAGAKDWKAAAWMLERQFPERWGRPPLNARSLVSDPDDAQSVAEAAAEAEAQAAAGGDVDPFKALERDEVAERRKKRGAA